MSLIDHLYVRLKLTPKKEPQQTKCGFCKEADAHGEPCRYCGKMFCDNHHPPEYHACDYSMTKPWLYRRDHAPTRQGPTNLSENEKSVRFYKTAGTTQRKRPDHRDDER